MKKANQILILSAFLLTFIVTKQLNVMQDTEEIWKDVPSYVGHYKISQTGKIKSLTKIVECKDGSKKPCNGKILKPRINPNGYLQTVLSKNGVIKYYYIHRLVALAFIENPNRMPQVNHINKIKTDNRVENLEWVMPRENVSHSKSNKTSKYTGVHFHNPKEYNPKKKWGASILINKKIINLGYYRNEEDARDAYRNALRNYNLENKYA